jgi:hypothetical protein
MLQKSPDKSFREINTKDIKKVQKYNHKSLNAKLIIKTLLTILH